MAIRSLKDLFQKGTTRKFKKGQVILHQGDQIPNVFYIKKGYIKIYNILDTGEERILLMLGRGQAFPMTTAINRPDFELRYFYEAMVDTELIAVPVSKFLGAMDRNYEAIQVFLEYITHVNRFVVDRLEVLEGKNAHDKLKQVLPYLIELCGKEVKPNCFRLKLKLTHQDIANLTGLTRETASIQIKKLEDEKVLEQKNGYMFINIKSLT